MSYEEILNSHVALSQRRINSNTRIDEIRGEFNKAVDIEKHSSVSIFCGGSIARGDIGKKSDLDLFILFNKRSDEEKKIESLELLYQIIKINKKLGFPQFSNDAQYIKNYSFPEMLEVLGSPQDDNANLFTVRMLLLLESKPILNDPLYEQYIDLTLENYFRDCRGRDTFKPLFLLNDLLRFWRTMCLNYEIIRNNPDKPWRKKNINLKFSRMLTVFGTVLPIIAEPATTESCVRKLIHLSPIERLAYGLDMLGDNTLSKKFSTFLDHYEEFLAMKENMGEKLELDDVTLGRKSNSMAVDFSSFLHEVVTHPSIDPNLVKYLVI